MARLDTSIYRTNPLRSVADYEADLEAADDRKAKREMNALALSSAKNQQADYQRGLDRQNRLQSILGRFGDDAMANARALVAGGFLKEAGDYQKSMADAAKAQQEAEKERLAQARERMTLVGQVAGAAKDQASYEQGLAALAAAGVDVSREPAQFDPVYVDAARTRALTAAEQIGQVWKQRGYDLDVQKFDEEKRQATEREKVARGQLSVAQDNLAQRKNEANYQQTKDALDRSNPRPKASGPMSVTLQKELIESDDAVAANRSIKDMLAKALSLNKTAYSGVFAKERAVVRSNIPGQSASADATIDLDNMMTGQALESLKAIFGGMPTEGERKILLDMQASADKTPAQRESIIKRAMEAADRRGKMAQAKAKAIREGTYLTEGVPILDATAPNAEPKKPSVSDW